MDDGATNMEIYGIPNFELALKSSLGNNFILDSQSVAAGIP